MQASHQIKRRLVGALAAIATMAIAAVVFDQELERLAQEKTTVMQAADDILPRPMAASVNRDRMIVRKDLAATLRKALPDSPRLEFLALVVGMLLVTVGGLLAIYLADGTNARHNQ